MQFSISIAQVKSRPRRLISSRFRFGTGRVNCTRILRNYALDTATARSAQIRSSSRHCSRGSGAMDPNQYPQGANDRPFSVSISHNCIGNESASGLSFGFPRLRKWQCHSTSSPHHNGVDFRFRSVRRPTSISKCEVRCPLGPADHNGLMSSFVLHVSCAIISQVVMRWCRCIVRHVFVFGNASICLDSIMNSFAENGVALNRYRFACSRVSVFWNIFAFRTVCYASFLHCSALAKWP